MSFPRYHAPALSINYDRETLKEIINLYAEGVVLLKDQDDFTPVFVCQPLLPNILPKDDIGNAMGIKPEAGPLIRKLRMWSLEIRKLLIEFSSNSIHSRLEVDRHEAR